MKTDEEVIYYLKDQFRTLGASMYPNGLEWGSKQHRDIVRLFMAGCLVMDQDGRPGLYKFVQDMTNEFWTPGDEYQWPTADSN